MADQNQYFAAEAYAKKMEKGELSFPETYRPEDRDAQYMLRMCEYVYGSYSFGNTYIRNGGIYPRGRSLFELRAYGRGEQDVQKYKKILDFRSDQGERRELDQISWENTKVMNRFRTQALSRVGSFKYQPGVRAVDDLANEQRLNAYLRDKLATTPAFKNAVMQTGVMPDGVDPATLAMNTTDIDAFNMLGGYTLAGEVLLTDAIQASLEVSGWDNIGDRVNEDLFDFGFASAMVHRLPGDKKYLVKYVDPYGVIVPQSTHNDFRDSQYRAIIERMSIAQLRLESNLSEDQILTAAKTYQGYQRNPRWTADYDDSGYDSRRNSFSALRSARYDEFSVDVMTVYFVALDIEKYIRGNHKSGAAVYDRVGSDSKLDRKDEKRGKEMEAMPVQYIYKCRWIVGTNMIFDYGKDDTIVRAGDKGCKEALFPLVVYALNEPSMIERCIPIIDDIEIAVRKKRLSLATLPPGPGYMIDMSIMEDSVKIGDQTYSAQDLLGLYFNTGWLFYRSMNEWDRAQDGASNRPPITPMQSQKLAELQTFLTEIQSLLNDLSNVIGSNSIVEGSADPSRVLNGVASQLQAAANSALYGNITAMKDIYLIVERVLGLKYQYGTLYGDIKISYIPGSRSMPKTVQLDSSMLDHEFYFTAQAMPSMEDKQNMVAMLQKLSAERRVSEDVFFAVSNMIQEGDVKKAQWLMSIEAAKADKRTQEANMQAIQAQAQANSQSAQAAEQARAQTEVIILNGKKELASVESALRIKEEENKSRLRILEKTAQTAQEYIGTNMAVGNPI